MLGMRPGDTRHVDVTFPEVYHAEALAGKQAVFEVAAKALGRQGEPDEALALKLGFETLDKLREMVTSQIQREYDQMARLRIKRELLDHLAERAQFPAPQNLVETEFGAIWQRVEADLRDGRVDDEDAGRDPETLKAEYRAIADRRVRLGLLLSEVGRAANIQVTQAELNQALRREAARYPGQEMQVVEFFRKNQQAVEQLRGPIFEDKVVDYILEMATIEDRLVSPEELSLPAADLPGSMLVAVAEEPTPIEGTVASEVSETATPAGDEVAEGSPS
jgi:trigger factor